MKEQLLYRDLARYYDLVYDRKDYRTEAARLKKFIRKYQRSAGNDLLDVACGTGRHLQLLKDSFQCTGVDLSGGMLRIARERHPDIRFRKADMLTMDLGRKFDVVTCLFSSIGYVKTHANLAKALRNFARHLKPGGVMLVEGWHEPRTYMAGTPGMTSYDSPDMKIVRVHCGRRRGDRSIMDMHYLVAERGKEVKHFVDRHEMGLFKEKKFVTSMKRAGLGVAVINGGLIKKRNLYVGVKLPV